VLLAPMLSAFGGAAARRELGYAFWPAWNQWFLGDAIANLVLTPAILYWCSGLYRELRPRVLEILCWIVGFTACLYYSLSLIPSPIPLYAPVPFLIWAAIRFGPIGASSSLSFIALLSMVSVAGGKESISASLGPQHVLAVQLFLAVMSVPVLCVAILIKERGAVETRLRENQETLSENYDRVRDLAAKLINAQDDERRRIALELHDDIGQRMALLSMRLGRKPIHWRFARMRMSLLPFHCNSWSISNLHFLVPYQCPPLVNPQRSLLIRNATSAWDPRASRVAPGHNTLPGLPQPAPLLRWRTWLHRLAQ
jgi:MASE1/Histidine kinase